MDDNALLRQYAENDSDEAFATLVTRHVNLVYSVAMRQSGNQLSLPASSQCQLKCSGGGGKINCPIPPPTGDIIG
jgi:hypothetical protein